MDPDGREDSDIEIVRSWIYEASNFIINHQSDEIDQMIAEKLIQMLNEGRVQIDDVTKRYETKNHPGHSKNVFAYFDPFFNTETNENRNIIVIDINKTIETGLSELIDTLTHEIWHAIQFDLGLITVDDNNVIHFYPNKNKIENDSNYLGVKMYNKYAAENNLPLKIFLEEIQQE